MGRCVLHVHEPLVPSIYVGLLQSDPHWKCRIGIHELALHPSLEMALRMSFMDDV